MPSGGAAAGVHNMRCFGGARNCVGTLAFTVHQATGVTISSRKHRGNDMTELAEEREAFKRMRDELEAKFKGKWALIYKSDLIATFDTFDEAAQSAVARFGRGPFLIRQVGAPETMIPASLAYSKMNYA